MDATMSFGDIPGIGEMLSASSAVLWALSVVLFRRAGDTMAPSTLNLFKGTVAMILMVPTLLLMGVDFIPDGVTPVDWLTLLASGFFGIGIADTMLFAALNKVGPGRYAIINCSFGPVVILTSTLVLGEPVSWSLAAAAALIIVAILLSVRGPVRRRRIAEQLSEAPAPRLGRYYLLGMAGVAMIAVSIVLAKPVLDRTDGVWGTFARLCGGLIFLVPQGLLPRNIDKTINAFRPGPAQFNALLPSFIGAYLCTLLWTLGMKYTYASVAGVLNQLTNILLFPFAFLILKERIQPGQVAAVLIGIGAGLLIILTA